ncbi:hypothetical protein SCUCBS95973_001173 [Sporothrix curviconia]|uniref:Zn(2)-C6 fungal-type domain-containing protein n=1 Tax=Sporothrix curviconia TaxID=1260050 RepID=A0ABP0AWH7_9PEZI
MASALQPSTAAATEPSSTSAGGVSANVNVNDNTVSRARTSPSAESRPMNQQQAQSQEQQQQQQQQGPTVLTFALKHRPRATRASVPKCDEVKPACNRCIKWQGFCEGYEDVPESTATTTTTTRRKTTKTAAAEAVGAPAKAKPTETPPGGASSTNSNSSRRRHPTKPGNKTANAIPHTIRTIRASSTASSSTTQGSRRTTPVSDVSVTEYQTVTSAASRTNSLADESARSLAEEGEDQNEDETEGEEDGEEDDDIKELAYVPMPAFREQRQLAFKRARPGDNNTDGDDDDDTYDAYTEAHGDKASQPFFDVSLIHGDSSSSPSSSLSAASSATAFPLEPNYNSVMFASQWEKAYFDSWLALAPNLGGGWFPSHLWTSTIPQLCRDEPAVRFAAIAIGAMAQAMSPALLGRSYHHMLNAGSSEGESSSNPPSLSSSSSSSPADGTNSASSPETSVASASRVVPHYRNALTYYGHALRLLRLSGGGNTGNTTEQGHPNRHSTSLSGQQPYTGVDLATPPSSEKERAAVLSCLLFVCFEALQGNREGALKHITHGLQIVDQFVARNLPPGVQDASWTPQPRTTGQSQPHAGQAGSDAEWQRRRQRQRQRDRQLGLLPAGGVAGGGDSEANLASGEPHKGNSSGGHHSTGSEDRPSDALTRVLTRSPASYMLEDEVMQVFRRLDFQAWSLGVFRLRRTRPADIKFKALDALNPATIPACFDSLDDARRWWDFVQHWILQFPRYMVAALQRYMDENPDAATQATAAGRMLDICDVPGAREIQREYLDCLERWNAAFHPLYDASRRHKLDSTSSCSSPAEAAFLKAASLKIQYLLAWIGVSSLVYSDYEAMYQLTPQFRELNRLAALILPKQPKYTWSPFGGGATMLGAGSTAGGGGVRGDLFTMDNGPTMALFVVSCKCRVEAVRDESIRLLAAYPRRDGFWDSKILWAIADWNRVIEAENETEGSLYEQWLRLRQREAIFDETKPEVQMTAWVKNKVTGKFEKLTQTVKWDR